MIQGDLHQKLQIWHVTRFLEATTYNLVALQWQSCCSNVDQEMGVRSHM
jgi:hypothetical protein